MNHQIVKNMLGQLSVKYSCPGCQTKLRSPISEAGQSDTCPECNTGYVVPGKNERIKIEQKQRQAQELAIEEQRKKQAEKEEQRKRKEESQAQLMRAQLEATKLEQTAISRPETPPPVSQSRSLKPSMPPLPNLEPPIHDRPLSPVPRQMLLCPYCHGELNPGVQKCRHCGEFLVGTGHSDALAGCLGFMLGPVGLWYKGHFAAGFAWLAFSFLFFMGTGGLGLLLAPVFWIAMGIHAASVKGKR